MKVTSIKFVGRHPDVTQAQNQTHHDALNFLSSKLPALIMNGDSFQVIPQVIESVDSVDSNDEVKSANPHLVSLTLFIQPVKTPPVEIIVRLSVRKAMEHFRVGAYDPADEENLVRSILSQL